MAHVYRASTDPSQVTTHDDPGDIFALVLLSSQSPRPSIRGCLLRATCIAVSRQGVRE